MSVYFAEKNGRIKIGFSERPQERAKATPPPTAPGRAALSPLPWSAGDEPAGDHTLPGGSTPPNTHTHN